MGFLKRFFGAGTAQEYVEAGDRLFEKHDFGAAKLEYERALDKLESGDASRPGVQEMVDACLDKLALRHIAEARRLIDQGDPELAQAELESALEVVATDDVRKEVQAVVDQLERIDAEEQAVETELTDDERYTVISGSWEDAQADEYDELGEPFREAILKLHDGEIAEARPLLEALLDEAEAPRYLWLEIGRVRLMTEDNEGGKEALEEFLDSLAADEIGDARLAAHVELARLADEDGDFEGAMAQFQSAVETFDNDYRAYFAMGAFLRRTGHAEEAIEILDLAAAVMDDLRPDWQVMQELGLAHRDAKQPSEAVDWLERVISFLTDRKHIDFPPSTAVPLAQIHEEEGRLERAADLYASLAKGSDVDNLATYHRHAARLLAKVGLNDEARRLYQRALAQTKPDDESRAEIEAAIADLE